jgi:toxin ParE1/3/4
VTAVIVAPQAEQDVSEIADYLAGQSPDVALRFLDAVENAFTAIGDMPELGGVYETDNPRLQNLRVRTVPDFPNHLVFYRTRPTLVEIVRVLYGARDLDHLS